MIFNIYIRTFMQDPDQYDCIRRQSYKKIHCQYTSEAISSRFVNNVSNINKTFAKTLIGHYSYNSSSRFNASLLDEKKAIGHRSTSWKICHLRNKSLVQL